MAFLSGIVFCGGLGCLSFYIGFRIGKDFAVYGALYHIGAVCQRVPVHVNAEAMAAISDAVFFQVRAVGDSGLVKAFYLLTGFFIGNGNSNRNSGVWQGRIPAPADNGIALKVIERAIQVCCQGRESTFFST